MIKRGADRLPLQDLKCTERSAVVSACPNQSNVPASE